MTLIIGLADNMFLEQLQKRLAYRFRDERILVQSLTHKSHGHEFAQCQPISLRDNERLEFLGDAILGLVVSDLLLEAFPDGSEGQLSKMRAAVVNEKTLAELAKSLRLQSVLRLGRGEAQTRGYEKPSILASTFEALIAAIYIDGGFVAASQVLRQIFSPIFFEGPETMVFSDHKTKLQEVVQAKYKITPTYHIIQAVGPDHAKTFEIEVRMNGQKLGSAHGSSKKEAEQKAAKVAFNSSELKVKELSWIK